MSGAILAMTWENTLADEGAIADYMEANASDEVCTEMIMEYFHGCGAKLMLLPIEDISEGHPDVNIKSAKKEKKYNKLPLETMPPIVVMDGIIEDGHHRYRIAKAKGAASILCYVVEPYPEPVIEPARSKVMKP